MSGSLRPHGLEPARLLCPWNFLGKNTGVSFRFLLQGIFLTHGLNPRLFMFLPLSCHLPHSARASQVALVVNNPLANAEDVGDSGLIPGVGKISWRKKWQPTPVLSSEESHGQRSLAGYGS